MLSTLINSFYKRITYPCIKMVSVNIKPVIKIIGSKMLAGGGHLQRPRVQIRGVLSSLDILKPSNIANRIHTDCEWILSTVSWVLPHLGSLATFTFGHQNVNPAWPKLYVALASVETT